MKTYIVSYDLTEKLKNRDEIYVKLLNRIPLLGGNRKLINIWEIKTSLSFEELTKKIKTITGGQCPLMVSLSEKTEYSDLEDLQ